MVKTKLTTKRLVTAGVCLALAQLLPMLTFQNQQLGSMFSLMHIPVFVAGFACGWPLGLAVGFISPLLRSVTFGMPPLFPQAVAMSLELAAYGAVAGALYRRLPRKRTMIYVSLVGAMLVGRLVFGGAMAVLMGLSGSQYTLAMFVAAAFTNAVPGIICHILLVPLIVMALEKAHLSER